MKSRFFFLLVLAIELQFSNVQAQRITLPDGSTPFFSGMNVAWRNFGGDIADTPANLTDWAKVLDEVKAAGGNTIRWWLFVNCSQTPKFDANGYVSGLGTQSINNVKAVLDLAEERNMVVILCLFSFDMLQTSQWGVNEANNKKLLQTDAGIQASLDKAVVPLVTAIGKHPSVLCWEIFNEPEGMTSFGWTPSKVSMYDIQRYVNRAAGAIHRAVPGIKVSNGSWNMKVLCNKIGYKNYYSDAELKTAGGDNDGYLDFYMVHYYNNDGGDNTQHSPFHHTSAYWGIDKPIIVAEYTAKGFTDPYLTPKDCFQKAYDNNYAGALAWTYTNHDGFGGLTDATPGISYLSTTHPADITLNLSGGDEPIVEEKEECPQFVNTLIDAKATKQTIALKHYLDSVYNNTNNRLSGQMDTKYLPYIYNASGKYPAIVGFDFDGICPSQTKGNIDAQKAIAWVKDSGGIAQFSWHWISPDANGDYYTQNFNLANALADVNSQSYKNIIRDLDLAAAELLKLQEAGVAVLWRPLHEAEGGWFWWGRSGGAACQTLYKLMYDRFTNYHNLHNLIWVWTSYGSKYQNWYPGDNYVDMIVWDYPATEGGANAWNQYQTLFKDKGKIFAIGEEGGMADPSTYDTQPWLYFLTWAYMILDPKDDARGENTAVKINEIYNNAKVITLDKLPNWNTYGPCTSTVRTNVALHKPVTVSSTEVGINIASNVTDGDKLTRWSSLYSDPQWVQIDLQNEYIISEIQLFWEAAYSTSYILEISEDGNIWKEVTSTTTGNGATDRITFLPQVAKFVKLTGTKRVGNWGHSLYEIEVYQANLALKKPVAASSTEAGFGNILTNCNDSLQTTRWSSLYTNNEFLTVDLQHMYTIDKVRIFWEDAFGLDYSVQISTDSIVWKNVYTHTNGNGGIDAINIDNQAGRYVKFVGSKRATDYGYSIFELEVYGKKYTAPVPITQTIQLQQGWNLISTNLHVSDSTIATMFNGLDVQMVKNNNGFWKKGQVAAFNSLQTITSGQGYLVYMNSPGILTVAGLPLSIINYQLSINSGWNLIGCPYQNSTPFTTYFNAANTQIIKDFEGFWMPNDALSTITNLVPGKGYYIKK